MFLTITRGLICAGIALGAIAAAGSAAQADTFAAVYEKGGSNFAWVARHGMKGGQYQAQFDKWTNKGYRLIDVSCYGQGPGRRYAAIWQRTSGAPYVARHGMTSAQYQAEFNKWTKKGYRLTDVSGCGMGGATRYAAIWQKRGNTAWRARHGLTGAQYQNVFNQYKAAGYRPVHVSCYGAGGGTRYAAIWVKNSASWVARHGLTSAKYQAEFNKWTKKGYRLISVSVCGNRYAAIWMKRGGSSWIARHGLNANQYQKDFNMLTSKGYRLRIVSASK